MSVKQAESPLLDSSSNLHDLPFALHRSASVWIPTLSACVSFCSLLSEGFKKGGGVEGSRPGLETQAGVGVVAAERDGYNNPCGGSTHVLNYCHKCSSGERQAEPSEASSLSSSLFPFSVT